MEWQLIESAPKNGTPILVWGSHDIYSTPTYGIFQVTFSGDFREGKKYWRWVVPGLTCPIDATHWMPLPKDPAAQEREGSRDAN